MSELFISGGVVIDPEKGEAYPADVLVREGVIAAMYLRYSHAFVAVGRLLSVAARYGVYAAVMFVPVYALARQMPPSWTALLVQIAVGVAVYAVLLLVCRDPILQLRKGGETK